MLWGKSMAEMRVGEAGVPRDLKGTGVWIDDVHGTAGTDAKSYGRNGDPQK